MKVGKIVKLLEEKNRLEKEKDKIKELFTDGRNLAVMLFFFLGSIGGIFGFERFWVKMCSLGVSLLIALSCFFLFSAYKKKKKTDREIRAGIGEVEKGLKRVEG